ncbi:hypothetical protein TNCV_4770521 [Trichonephila clavipes]|nr:hypothetical protein TNCV_4770521 [Trichonephila clavipes]
MGLRQPNGQGIGSWQACHEFEPNTTKDPPNHSATTAKAQSAPVDIIEIVLGIGLLWKDPSPRGFASPQKAASTPENRSQGFSSVSMIRTNILEW